MSSMWFHDGDTWYTVDTAREAANQAADGLNNLHNYALQEDNWSDEVQRVAWALVVQRAVEVPAGTRCADCGAEPGTMDWDDDECTAEPAADYVLRDVPDLAERIAEVLRDRPAVWLAVLRSMPQEVLGPWQANDRSKPPVPETVQRVRYGVGIVSVVWDRGEVRYGVGIVSVVWDRGEAFALRWRWRCGSGMGDAATRQEAEAAADQHARDRGVMLVDT